MTTTKNKEKDDSLTHMIIIIYVTKYMNNELMGQKMCKEICDFLFVISTSFQ